MLVSVGLDCPTGPLALDVNGSSGLGAFDPGGPMVHLRYYANLVDEVGVARVLVLRDQLDDVVRMRARLTSRRWT